MKKINKNIFNALFLLAVFGLTVYGVFKGEDLGELLGDIRQANPWYLLAGVACVVFYIAAEAFEIHYLLGTLSIPLARWRCGLVSFVGFFFCCITPSASGGQPMQAYYLKKEGVSLATSSLVLLLITIVYKLVLVLVGVGLLLLGRGFFAAYLWDVAPVFYLGIFLNVVCVAGLLLLVFHPKLARKMAMGLLDLLGRLRVLKRKPEWEQRLERAMDQYHETAGYLRGHRSALHTLFWITLVQRIALFAVTYFVYLALNLRGKSPVDILLLQAAIAVSVDMLPLPGGMGISESLFLRIFLPVFGRDLLLPGLILSRGIAYYAQLLLSAVMTVAAQFVLGKRTKTKV